MNGLSGLSNLPIQQVVQGGRAVVRVLPQAVYDSEVTGTSAISDLTFFNSPVGQFFQNANTTKKTLADTYLKQSGQLGSPLEFDLFGFNLKLNQASGVTPITQDDYQRFITNSYFEFTFGNRPFLQIPVNELPSGVCPEGFGTATNVLAIHSGVGHRSNIFKFLVGKYRVHIGSTEQFSAKVVWGSSVTFVASVKATVFLQGFLRNAL